MKVSAKDLVQDIKSGLSESEILAKFDISASTLVKFYEKLIAAGYLTKSDINKPKEKSTCPSCSKEIPKDSIKCKHCGIILAKYKKEPTTIQENESQEASPPTPPKTAKKTENKAWSFIHIVLVLPIILFGLFTLLKSFFVGMSLLVVGLMVFPPFINWIQNTFKLQLSGGKRFIICFVLISSFAVINTALSPTSTSSTEPNRIEQTKIPKTTKSRSSTLPNLVGTTYRYPQSSDIIDKYGEPQTLSGTNNSRWIAYFPQGNFTIIANKQTNIIQRVLKGRRPQQQIALMQYVLGVLSKPKAAHK